MIYALLFLLCVIFLELFIFFDLRKEVMSIIGRSREALHVLMSAAMEDDEKEAFMRRESLEMLKATGMFATKFFVVIVVLYLVYLLIVTVFPDRKDAILESFVSPSVIAILTIATLCYAWARNAILKQL